MIKIRTLNVFATITCCGAADNTRDYGAVVLRSNPVPPSLFYLIFTYWRAGRLSTPCTDGVDFAHTQTG